VAIHNGRVVRDGRSEITLLAAAAAWGLATSISLWRLFAHPAPPGQVGGFMSAHNLDARGPQQHIFFVVALTIAAVFVARMFAARFVLLRPSTQRLTSITLATSLAIVTVDPSPLIVSVIPAVMAAIWIALRDRDWRFAFSDVVLIPSSIVVAIALMRLTSMSPPAAVVVAIFVMLIVRIGAVFLAPIDLSPATAFLLSPLGMIGEASSGSAIAHATALIAAILLPLLIALAARSEAIRTLKRHRLVANVVYPIFLVAYAFALLNGSPPYLNLYESGHDLVPAAEVARGEKYYRDVIPMHGLLTDGALDSLAMEIFGEPAGNILRFRFFIAALNAAAIYAAAACATGSAEAGLLAALLTLGALPSQRVWIHIWPRCALAVFAVAAAAGATRRGSIRWLAIAGSIAVFAIAQSVDFGIYALLTVIVVPLFWSRPRIVRAAAAVAIGIAAGIVILAAALAINGILVAFISTTFGEILSLGPSFSVGFFDVNRCCPGTSSLSDVVLQALLSPATLPYVVWPLVLIWFAIQVVQRKATLRWRAAMVIAAWIIVAAISYTPRQDYAAILVPALAVVLIASMRRRLLPIVLCIAAAHPAWHLLEAMPAIARPTVSPQVAAIGLPRARGAVVERSVAPAILVADAYMRQTLPPDATYFDFSNVPGLYYLTERRLPIRQIQVAQYEDVRLQREVIAALERDRSVQLALIRFPYFSYALDGVSNATRAPLVAQYLQTHFAPAFEQGGVVFWKRR
jgi:hypothetical protein